MRQEMDFIFQLHFGHILDKACLQRLIPKIYQFQYEVEAQHSKIELNEIIQLCKYLVLNKFQSRSLI